MIENAEHSSCMALGQRLEKVPEFLIHIFYPAPLFSLKSVLFLMYLVLPLSDQISSFP